MTAAITPEERLLRLGELVRGTNPTLAAWTREVELQLRDLRDDMETMREANDLWSGK